MENLNGIEFYSTPQGEVMIKEAGKTVRELAPEDIDFVGSFLAIVGEFYPEAFAALAETYSSSHLNRSYYEWLMARRFIKCNFGNYDSRLDVNEQGYFRMELVECPLHGECKYDGIICRPKFCTQMSSRELEVMRRLNDGYKEEEVSNELHIAINTVITHRKNALRKLGLHSMAEFGRYAKKHEIF